MLCSYSTLEDGVRPICSDVIDDCYDMLLNIVLIPVRKVFHFHYINSNNLSKNYIYFLLIFN